MKTRKHENYGLGHRLLARDCINSSDGGELPIMATEDGAGESFWGGPGGGLGRADKFLGGGPRGVVSPIIV